MSTSIAKQILTIPYFGQHANSACSEHPMGIRTYTKRVLNFRRQAIVEQKTAGGIPSAVHLPVLRLFDRDRLFLG